jgi:hypothetical protein
VDPVTDPLLLRKKLVAPGIEPWPLDHRGGPRANTDFRKQDSTATEFRVKKSILKGEKRERNKKMKRKINKRLKETKNE